MTSNQKYVPKTWILASGSPIKLRGLRKALDSIGLGHISTQTVDGRLSTLAEQPVFWGAPGAPGDTVLLAAHQRLRYALYKDELGRPDAAMVVLRPDEALVVVESGIFVLGDGRQEEGMWVLVHFGGSVGAGFSLNKYHRLDPVAWREFCAVTPDVRIAIADRPVDVGYVETFGSFLAKRNGGINAKAWFGEENRIEQLESAFGRAWAAVGQQWDIYRELRNCIALDRHFKPGVLFQYVMDIFSDPVTRRMMLDRMEQHYRPLRDLHPNLRVAGVASRGFPIAAFLAARLDVGYVPIVEGNKYSGEGVYKPHYTEYDTDKKAPKYHGVLYSSLARGGSYMPLSIILLDDLNATGDTARASIEALQETARLKSKMTAEIVAVGFVSDVPGLRDLALTKIGQSYDVFLPPDYDERYQKEAAAMAAPVVDERHQKEVTVPAHVVDKRHQTAPVVDEVFYDYDVTAESKRPGQPASSVPAPLVSHNKETPPAPRPTPPVPQVTQDTAMVPLTAPVPPVLDSQSSNVLLLGLPCDPDLNRAVSAKWGVPLGKIVCTKFSNGETRVEIGESCEGKHVFILQSVAERPGHTVQDACMELLVTADAANMAGAKSVVAVLPLIPYSRQDKKNYSRACITVRLFAKLCRASGIRRIITMDLHSHQIQGMFDFPVDNLYTEDLLVHRMRETMRSDEGRAWKRVVVASPDMGGLKRVERVAAKLGVSFVGLSKTRLEANKVASMTVAAGDSSCLQGAHVYLLDDMCDTGGTLVEGTRTLLGAGAVSVEAWVIHPVLSGDGLAKLDQSALLRLTCLNTQPTTGKRSGKIRVLDMSGFLASALSFKANGQSLQPHFVPLLS